MENKKIAFTLAEVLITLVIIGVIATITIPNLMQSYRKHQVEVGVKEAYSILNNALTMAKAEHGSFEEMFDTIKTTPSSDNSSRAKDLKFFNENYLIPYLKINKRCPRWPNHSVTCLPYLIDGQRKIYSAIDNSSEFFDQVYSDRIVLPNGMILFVVYTDQSFNFFIDINGFKKPNKGGVDIFAFSLIRPGSGHCELGWDNFYCNHGTRLHFGKLTGYENAQITCSGGSDGCTKVIAENGWKIPDDYPVKKF